MERIGFAAREIGHISRGGEDLLAERPGLCTRQRSGLTGLKLMFCPALVRTAHTCRFAKSLESLHMKWVSCGNCVDRSVALKANLLSPDAHTLYVFR